MKFSEKLLKNWECGLYTLVENKRRKQTIFSTKYDNKCIRYSGFWSDKELIFKYIGYRDKILSFIDSDADKYDWEIIETIHPSELMGQGFKKGQKVKFRKNIEKIFEKAGRNFDIDNRDMVEKGYGYFGRYVLGECEIHRDNNVGSGYEVFPITAIELCLEESDTVDITVEGKTKTISRKSAKELNLID